MASHREQVLAALFGRLQGVPDATVRRNEALPVSVPAGGLIILRDGDPGEPDVTLNPRTEYYTHRAEIEAFVTQPVPGSQPGDGGGEEELDALLSWLSVKLNIDRSLGGLAENLTWSAPETSVLAIEGAAPILTARITVTIEYLVSDPLAA
ncbi:MAG: acyl-CoA transferase [Defluviicoccus sp.]|nr:acyl-CoA transferase [Defluviicoccus sp.]MDG4591533.1 acyl-CoA transferase [Defluviicoccus sp.]